MESGQAREAAGAAAEGSAPAPPAGGRGAAARVGVALACSMLSFFLTNGSIYPAIVTAGGPWVREAATAFSVAVLVVIVWMARRAPRLLHPRAFSGVALAAVAGYLAFDLIGLRVGSVGALLVGSLLDSAAEAWLFVLAYVAFAQLGATQRVLTAMASCLAVYAVQPFASWAPPEWAVAINAGSFALLFVCVGDLADGPLRQARHSEPQAEMAVAEPLSFLPTGHLLFVTVLVFSMAQGLALLLPGPFHDAPALPLASLPLAALLVVYLVRGEMPNADGLFSLCALLIIGGMFLLPSDRVLLGGSASLAHTLINAGDACFGLLLLLLVGSIAGRNRVTALPTAALMLALYWLGIGLGAVLGYGAMALLGWTEVALAWTSFVGALLFIGFCFLALKGVSFAEVIGSIRPSSPAAPPATPPLEAKGRCEAVARAHGLTPRESEVLELLAQGRTVGVIRERLVISLNTARFHTKNIYAKLGVHSQQELIDLVEAGEADDAAAS